MRTFLLLASVVLVVTVSSVLLHHKLMYKPPELPVCEVKILAELSNKVIIWSIDGEPTLGSDSGKACAALLGLGRCRCKGP